MPGPGITIEVFGEKQIARRLSRFGEDIKDFRPAWEGVINVLREATRTHFARGGRGWKPLSPNYATWKAKKFPGKTIMRRTDSLYASLTQATGDSVIEKRRQRMRWGTKLDYAAYHQLGRGVPQRRVIDLAETERNAVMKELQKFVVAKSKREY